MTSESKRRLIWANEKRASISVNRGLIHNTVKVDGQDYKVNEGYLKPAFFGFATSALTNALINLHRGIPNSFSIKNNLIAGAVGATAGMALTEVKRRSIENVLKSDPDSAKSLARKGFDIKARNIPTTHPMVKDIPEFVRGMYSQSGFDSLAEEGIKVSSMNEFKMMRDLDEVEDNTNKAHMAYEAVAVASVISDVSRPDNIEDISNALKETNAQVVFISKKDSLRSEGTRSFSFDEFKKTFPNTFKTMSEVDIDNAKKNGILAVSASNLNKASVLREINRVKNKFSSIPSNKTFKVLGKANLVYSLAAKGNDSIADATAGAQFALYAPRIIEDMKATINTAKLHKGTLVRNLAFTGTRALPGILPALGRAYRHYQDKKSNI